MPPWITYALLAVILLLPIFLAFVGDEEPDNSIRHESGEEPPQDEPDGLLMVA